MVAGRGGGRRVGRMVGVVVVGKMVRIVVGRVVGIQVVQDREVFVVVGIRLVYSLA